MPQLIFALIAAFSSTAFASVLIGNPNSGVVIVAGSSTYVKDILAHRCSGGTQVISIQSVLDVDDKALFTYDQTLFCSIDVRVKWVPGGPLKTVPVGGFDQLKVVSGAAWVSIDIDATTRTAMLN